jgi:carbamoyl-phosphate synthase small subunit
MALAPDRKLILEDGQEYYGRGFGAAGDRILELVFNTSPVGYQEILSDPSYTDQAVVLTYPLIGNYGMAEDDYESRSPSTGALIVREYNPEPSNFRSVAALGDAMAGFGIPGIAGVDTRRLTRSIRDHGSRKVLITSASTPLEEGLAILGGYRLPADAVSRVGCREPREYGPGNSGPHVVAVDCGMKLGIPRSLAARGCRVTAVPWDSDPDFILSLAPDGLLVSNGPGDPADVPQTVKTVRALLGRLPLFGICLGHQILALAAGASTYKLKFGHRGGNHPVRELATGKIEITSQNHSYAVDADSLRDTPLEATHVNLLDGTVEGLGCAELRAFSVQYHPESSPGPGDGAHLFDRFVRIMKEAGGDA